jgi:hypothetical protein
MEGDVEITVMWEDLGPETAKGIALSIACGAACAPSGPSGLEIGEVPQAQPASSTPSPAGGGVATLETVPPTDYRIVAGLGTASDIVNVSYHEEVGAYWHGFDYIGAPEAALDLTDPDGDTDQRWVYVLSYRESGTATFLAVTQDYHTYNPVTNPSGSHCSGRYVSLRVYGDLYDVGQLTYVHLTNQQDPGQAWPFASGWTVRYLGTPATSQEAGCPFYSSNPQIPPTHLHQGMKIASPRLSYNTALPDANAQINPVSDYENNWMFDAVLTGDSDGDGCSDQEELGPNKSLGGQRDPSNPRDFYDITNITMAIGAKDKAVSGFDLNLLLAWGGATAGGPPNGNGKWYSADDNHNGLPDGREIDYASINGRGTGPDGGISGFDLIQMLYEGGDTCVAPP